MKIGKVFLCLKFLPLTIKNKMESISFVT